MAGLCLAMGGDGVALQPLSGLPRPQCGQCLAVALGSLLLEPIGPLSALGALVKPFPLLDISLVYPFQVSPQHGAGL
ncbi:hypothetical protein G6F22_021986 [Rhizopus arrhizus]|nr:hypothetical protein G6F22_021986 [Rhizopus arrhizus]KAG0920569.1 hypothetical protein G6F32_015532 [Rhizopus arrhizus]KAG1373289.1 hypothetical protein G6F60_015564 [Rhizopus arrhizus]